MKRAFSTEAHPLAASTTNTYSRIRQYKGPNINVASHNDERREAYKSEFNFKDSWGLGVEGFSHGGAHLGDMDPLMGSKKEYLWLVGFLAFIPIIALGRKQNEAGLASAVGKQTNNYKELNLNSHAKIQL